MKIFIRTDSSLKIGTGHVMRCITLAQILTKSNCSVTFICRNLEGNVISLIREKQFKIIELAPSSEPEIPEILQIIDSGKPDWIIVDHYSLDIEWERSVKSKAVKLLVIDDLLRKHMCDAILDQNYHIHHKEKVTQHLEKPASHLYLGPHFALLAESFRNQLPLDRNFKEVRNVMVFFGGTDATGETVKILGLIPQLDKKIQFDIIAGKTNPALKVLKEKTAVLDNVTLHIQTSQMADLMRNADAFIGSGGTSTWERCFFGLPSLCIAVADNQIEVSKNLHNINVLSYLGKSDDLTEESLLDSIRKFLEDKNKLKIFSENSKKLQVGSKINSIIESFRS